MDIPMDPERIIRARQFEQNERTRLGAQGELSFNIGSLMQELRSRHLISQIDRILEFPTSNALIPEAFKDKQIDSIIVSLGELQPQDASTNDVKANLETSMSIRLKSGRETLVMHRSSDELNDPSVSNDYIQVDNQNTDIPSDHLHLHEPISDEEVSGLIMSLLLDNHEQARNLATTINVLDPSAFVVLSDELEAKAIHRQVSGIYDFNDNSSELEFEMIDDRESFKITHTFDDGPTPRTIAASAVSAINFTMQFFIAEGADVRFVIPTIQDVESLNSIILKELGSTKKANRKKANEPITLPIDIAHFEDADDSKQIQLIDDKHTEIALLQNSLDALDTLELGKTLNQDGFDAPDSGAA